MSTVQELYAEAEKLKAEGAHDKAIEKLGELLEMQEDYTLAHLALAILYGKVNRHDDAVKHGQRACELDPEDPFTFTAMSVAFQRAFQGTQNQEFIKLAEDAMAKAHMLQAQG